MSQFRDSHDNSEPTRQPGDPDVTDLEAELRAALRERADQIHPDDRWTEIEMSTTPSGSSRRWPTVLLAAAAVLAVALGAWVLRPTPRAVAPADPTPPATATSSSPPPSASSSAAPSQSPSASPSATDVEPVDPFGGTVPVYYISPEALGHPESGLGLRRAWVPAVTAEDPRSRAMAAIGLALDRSTARDGGIKPWLGVGVTDAKVADDGIDVVLDPAPTARVTPEVGSLAVQQLVWTAQAAVGRGNVPVRLTVSGATSVFGVDISQPFTRPARDQQHTILTDLWITEPSSPTSSEGGGGVATRGQTLTVKGEASVFEANVQWELVRSDGTVAENGFTTATIGAPSRGTYEFTVTIPQEGDDYVLRVFSSSMQDGQGELASDTFSFHVL